MVRTRSGLATSAAVLAILITGCAGLRLGGRFGREPGFGPPAALPEDAAALGQFFRGEIALGRNDTETALAAFEAAVAADPATPLLRLRLASLYVRSGQLDRALDESNVAVAAEPNNVEALALQAGVLSSLGRDDEAAAVDESIL